MKFICVGRNYAEHVKELGNKLEEKPLIFLKPESALLQNGKIFVLPEHLGSIHHELEIILKINRNGKCIDREFAHKYYDEIGLGIDFTARELQNELKGKGHPWELAKGFDQSAVVGNFIPKEEINNPQNIHFHLLKNDIQVQEGFTKDLMFQFDYLIHYISQYFTLKMGDIIFTGTPSGVGPVQSGDELVGFLEGRELLRTPIR
jgi:2-keto-4-pentenoate hydratase/2-oxohepta-3-ene-1,7-dioic acid hydratase in catechol pathway